MIVLLDELLGTMPIVIGCLSNLTLASAEQPEKLLEYATQSACQAQVEQRQSLDPARSDFQRRLGKYAEYDVYGMCEVVELVRWDLHHAQCGLCQGVH